MTQGGAILISGGTGALGLLVAVWLRAICPDAALVLLGRTGRSDPAALQKPLWRTLMAGAGQVTLHRLTSHESTAAAAPSLYTACCITV